MARVLVTFSDAIIQEVSIPMDAVFTIGRDQDNMLILDNDEVSRFHAQIEKLGSSFYVVDLGSTNGTMLNNKRVWNRASLKEDDRIGISNFEIIFMKDPTDDACRAETGDGTATMPVARPAIKPKKSLKTSRN